MFIQGLTSGAGDICSYRVLHVGLVMYAHTCGAGDVCSYRVLHVGLVMYVHTWSYMWGW